MRRSEPRMVPATEGVQSVFAEWMSQGLNEHSQASSGRRLSVSTPHTHPSEREDHISPVSNGFCRILEDGGHGGCFCHLRSLLFSTEHVILQSLLQIHPPVIQSYSNKATVLTLLKFCPSCSFTDYKAYRKQTLNF